MRNVCRDLEIWKEMVCYIAMWLGPLVLGGLLENESGEVNWSQGGSPTQRALRGHYAKTRTRVHFLHAHAFLKGPHQFHSVFAPVPSTASFLT